MTRPTHPDDPSRATRDEVVRALLDPDRDQADELGRTRTSGDAEEHPMAASPREQAAAPINIQKVDE